MKPSRPFQFFLAAAAVVAVVFIYIALINSDMLNPSAGANAGRGGASQPVEVDHIGPFDAKNDTLISLKRTEGKSFILSGQVWLNGNPATGGPLENAPEGFSLYIREADDTHRYEFNSNFVRDKRRLLGGQPEAEIVKEPPFPSPPLRVWIPFSIIVTGNKITYTFWKYSMVLPGPLDVDGKNEIDLIAGSRLRNVKLELLGDAKAKY